MTFDPHTPEARRARRAEAQARFALQNLEAKLKPARLGDASATHADALGPGYSEIIHGEDGQPIGVCSVSDGQDRVDATALLEAYATLTKQTTSAAKAAFQKHGSPFLTFKQG